MAAYAAANNGHDVLLFEQNEKLGKKIYITGKGRCNFTNDVPPQEFLQNVVRGEKFLRGAIYTFSPQKVVEMLENYGLMVKTERGNRVFPVSDHASDVTKTLEKACKAAGVAIKLQEKVEKINTMQDIIPMPDIDCNTTQDIIPMPRIVSLKTNKGIYDCDVVIVATGGLS
jgi:predicted Rossmann fold flavoprotein